MSSRTTDKHQSTGFCRNNDCCGKVRDTNTLLRPTMTKTATPRKPLAAGMAKVLKRLHHIARETPFFRAGRDSADSEAVPSFSSLEAILWVAVAVATFNGVALMVRNTLLHFFRVLRYIERITGRIGTPAVWLAHWTLDKPAIWFGHGYQTRVSISVLPHSRASRHACSYFRLRPFCL